MNPYPDPKTQPPEPSVKMVQDLLVSGFWNNSECDLLRIDQNEREDGDIFPADVILEDRKY